MRLLVDLFACQTGSRFRGIGRYTHSLVRELIDLRGMNQMVMLASSIYPETFEDLRREYSGLLPQGSFLPYSHQAIDITKLDNDPNFEVSTTIVRHAYEMVSADVVLYPSVFEGWGERGVVPLPRNGIPSALCAAIVYDFIPYKFSDRFLDHDPLFKESYFRRLASYKDFDLLLAISESTRQDAIQILDLPPDKIVNISGAADSIFKKKEYAPEQIDSLYSRLRIRKPFIFYAGNAEYHKNMEKMLRAFSKLPPEIKSNHQIVLTHTGDEGVFRTKLRSMGLSNDTVVIPGHISDDDLVMLYNLCKLFIFPSLYEGFGLPILEAMACGAPVIASNNSSIPEVLERADAMFDASDEASISTALHNALMNDGFRKEMSAFGLERVKQFSWTNSAQKAWEAFEYASLQKKNQTKNSIALISRKKPRVALVTSYFTQHDNEWKERGDLLSYLQPEFEVDVFVKSDDIAVQIEENLDHKVFTWTEFLEKSNRYETVIYLTDIFNTEDLLIKYMREFPGVVISDNRFQNNSKMYSNEFFRNDSEPKTKFKEALRSEYGLKGLLEWVRNEKDQNGENWPIAWQVLKYAQEIIMPSQKQVDLLIKFYGMGWTPKVNVIDINGTVPDLEQQDATQKNNNSYRIHEQVQEVVRRAIQKNERHLFAPMINAMVINNITNEGIKLAATQTASNYSLRCQPRLLIDVSNISNWDAGTGVQRVVRNVIRELVRIKESSFRVDLVKILDGKLYFSYRYAEKLFGLPDNSFGEEISVEIRNGDYLYMLDSSWHLYDQFLPTFSQIRNHGGRIFTTVHDLIPILIPETCDKPVLDTFKHWIDTAIEQSDCLICVSQTVADEVSAYIERTKGLLTHSLDLSFVHNGSDISSPPSDSPLRDDVNEMVKNSQEPIFLMVGTIEPRKGHDFAIDAFEEIWQQGLGYKLCIIGKVGWKSADTETRIKTHPELGKRLFFIESATDAEVKYCYSHAIALVSPSRAEGFGLPIVEAAFYKIPSIVSDIPVFHEIGGDGSLYFSLESPKHLVHAIQNMTKLTSEERLAMAQKIETLPWKESASMIFEVLQNKRVYKLINPKINQ